jgi:hypothetical protein
MMDIISRIRSSFVDDVQRLSEERRIPKAAILGRALEGRYRSSTFSPFSILDDRLSMLCGALEKYPEAKFNLVAVDRMTDAFGIEYDGSFDRVNKWIKKK